MTDKGKYKFVGVVDVEGIPLMKSVEPMEVGTTAICLNSTLTMQNMDTNSEAGELRFKDGVFSFVGNADESAQLFLEHLALKYNREWLRLNHRLAAYESNRTGPVGGSLVATMKELMIADSVPMSDAWGRVHDRLKEIDRNRERENELNAVKRVRGWTEINMCMGCGTVATLEEIAARNPNAISCCPERKMLKTFAPANYQDPIK
jgi:hypothetical protein